MVTSYVAGHRTYEIGIRLALAATRSDVLKMVQVHGTRLAVTGVAGLVVAAGLTRLMAKILYGVRRDRSADVHRRRRYSVWLTLTFYWKHDRLT